MERLLKLLEHGHITPEIYSKKREEYEDQLLKRYLDGEITLDEICEMLDK